jgi:hypothetical protein
MALICQLSQLRAPPPSRRSPSPSQSSATQNQFLPPPLPSARHGMGSVESHCDATAFQARTSHGFPRSVDTCQRLLFRKPWRIIIGLKIEDACRLSQSDRHTNDGWASINKLWDVLHHSWCPLHLSMHIESQLGCHQHGGTTSDSRNSKLDATLSCVDIGNKMAQVDRVVVMCTRNRSNINPA